MLKLPCLSVIVIVVLGTALTGGFGSYVAEAKAKKKDKKKLPHHLKRKIWS